MSGRTAKEEQEQISPNHVPTIFHFSVHKMLPIRVSEVVVEPHEQLHSVDGELAAVLGVHDARVRIRCIYRAGTAMS